MWTVACLLLLRPRCTLTKSKNTQQREYYGRVHFGSYTFWHLWATSGPLRLCNWWMCSGAPTSLKWLLKKKILAHSMETNFIQMSLRISLTILQAIHSIILNVSATLCCVAPQTSTPISPYSANQCPMHFSMFHTWWQSFSEIVKSSKVWKHATILSVYVKWTHITSTTVVLVLHHWIDQSYYQMFTKLFFSHRSVVFMGYASACDIQLH